MWKMGIFSENRGTLKYLEKKTVLWTKIIYNCMKVSEKT